MCGIAGIISSRNEVNSKALESMEKAMVHRGPDDGGIYLSGDRKAGLVNRRLAVIDLSPAGHQPMSTPDGRFTIIHNGEVYNYREIREKLKVKGYTFNSNTDTEVVLCSYVKWGKDCLERFRGMFAFAVWDDLEKRLFLARDRLGIKPLYFAKNNNAFLFSSELKALMVSNYLSREINPVALVAYLMMGSVPCPLTIYKEIQALEPGFYLIWHKGELKTSTYWDFSYKLINISDRKEAVQKTRELLLESVKLRMISDVPLGAFLSGGLDSSAVVALMRKATTGPIRTCSMIFEEKGYSEAPYARAVAEASETEHYEKVVTAEDLKKKWNNIILAMDQPTIDGVNTYFVSETAREAGLTVALSGLGGDELFGGYRNTFHDAPRLLRLLNLVLHIPGGLGLAGWAVSSFTTNSKFNKLADAFSRRPCLASAYLVMRGLFSPSEVKALVLPEVWNEAIKSFDPIAHISDRATASTDNCSLITDNSLFNWVSRAELRTYTHHQLLRDTDAMSMAHSLEVRVPLLDHVLVELLLSLDEKFKKDRSLPKPLLVEAVGEDLPAIVRERKDKQGFIFPFALWLKKIPRDMVQDSFEVSSVLIKEKIEGIISDLYRGRVHWARPWALMVLNAWIQGVANSEQ